MDVSAVLWDFDGTIVDTISKHFLINKEMFSVVKPNEKLPKALLCLEEYRKAEIESVNWRDLYKNHIGFNEDQIDYAGSLWGELVSKSEISVNALEGVFDVIEKIKYPQGICSQNCSNNIRNILKKNNMDHHFKVVVGHLDIPFEKQKPHPAGFIFCVESMKIKEGGKIFYIGDHEQDVKFANSAKKEIRNFEIYSILASYSGVDPKSWNVKPDFEAKKAKDILSILEM
jgi:beta-phosphoglucomutase-like phosphatase (HAD superfamily)